MNFVPLGDRVAIELVEQEEKTAGGIFIPDSAKEKPSQGIVLAVGNGARDEKGNLIPVDLKVGQKVLFGKWAGTEVTIEGKKIMVMKVSDVIGVIL
jgi:chaperonin GroES